MESWVPILVALIGGVASAPVWNSVLRLLGRPQSEIDRLRKEVGEVRSLHAGCEEKVKGLTDRLAVIEHHHSSHFARWILDAHKRFSWVNDKALLTIFAPLGFGRDDVHGKTFHDLVDPSAASEIDRLDQAALANPGAAASNFIKLHPDLPLKCIVKVAGTGRDGELIYEGMAFRPNDPEIARGFGIARTAAARVIGIDRLAGDKERTAE